MCLSWKHFGLIAMIVIGDERNYIWVFILKTQICYTLSDPWTVFIDFFTRALAHNLRIKDKNVHLTKLNFLILK